MDCSYLWNKTIQLRLLTNNSRRKDFPLSVASPLQAGGSLRRVELCTWTACSDTKAGCWPRKLKLKHRHIFQVRDCHAYEGQWHLTRCNGILCLISPSFSQSHYQHVNEWVCRRTFGAFPVTFAMTVSVSFTILEEGFGAHPENITHASIRQMSPVLHLHDPH